MGETRARQTAGSAKSPSAEPIGSTPEEFAVIVQRDLAKWAKVARDANVKPQ